MRCAPAVVLVTGLFVVACESTSAAPTAPAPVQAPVQAPPPASVAAAGTSCLMTHICGCNLGCARVPVATAALHEGMKTTAQTGAYAGKDMLVTKETDAAGASVFALSDRDHAGACELTPASKSLMGFACASKDSGAVPEHACAHGCD